MTKVVVIRNLFIDDIEPLFQAVADVNLMSAVALVDPGVAVMVTTPTQEDELIERLRGFHVEVYDSETHVPDQDGPGFIHSRLSGRDLVVATSALGLHISSD